MRVYEHQEVRTCVCVCCVCVTVFFSDEAHPKMHFSISPPSFDTPKPKIQDTRDVTLYSNNWGMSADTNNNTPLQSSYTDFSSELLIMSNNNYKLLELEKSTSASTVELASKASAPSADTEHMEETISDYIQWLHAMKLVARLPGGVPPEFRRKVKANFILNKRHITPIPLQLSSSAPVVVILSRKIPQIKEHRLGQRRGEMFL